MTCPFFVEVRGFTGSVLMKLWERSGARGLWREAQDRSTTASAFDLAVVGVVLGSALAERHDEKRDNRDDEHHDEQCASADVSYILTPLCFLRVYVTTH